MSSDLFLLNLWRDLCGMEEIPLDPNPKRLSLEEIKRRNWSTEFDDLALNRMVIAFFRYGELGKQGKFNRMDYIINKVRQYNLTGNKECLVDIRNAAMAEFVESYHPNAHFKSLDDQEHGEKSA